MVRREVLRTYPQVRRLSATEKPKKPNFSLFIGPLRQPHEQRWNIIGCVSRLFGSTAIWSPGRDGRFQEGALLCLTTLARLPVHRRLSSPRARPRRLTASTCLLLSRPATVRLSFSPSRGIPATPTFDCRPGSHALWACPALAVPGLDGGGRGYRGGGGNGSGGGSPCVGAWRAWPPPRVWPSTTVTRSLRLACAAGWARRRRRAAPLPGAL